MLIGGGIAISGGVIQQTLSHVLSFYRSETTKEAQKLEDVLFAVYEHQDEMLKLYRGLSVEAGGVQNVSPLVKAQMLCALHFDDLRFHLHQVLLAAVELHFRIHQQHRPERRDDTESEAEAVQEWVNNAFHHHNETFQDFLNRAVTFLER